MNWAAILAAVQAVVNMAGQYGIPIAQATPGPIEKSMRKGVRADQERLAGGAGGMSAGRAGEAMAQQMGQVQQGYNQQMAQIGRGAALQGGSSGQLQQQQNLVGTQYQQAAQQAASNVRSADLQEAAAQRARNDQLGLAMIGQANARKAAFAQSWPSSDQGGGMMQGALQRGQTAEGMQGLNTKNLAGAMKGGA